MALKKYKPTTPGQRFKLISDFSDITKHTPEKSLTVPLKKTGGRNNQGIRTMRYIGGGHKKRYRIIDFKRDKDDIPAVVKSIEYDPNRSARIALLYYKDGEKRYIIAAQGLKVGKTLMSGKNAPPEVGNALFLKDIPLGTFIHNIELNAGQGGKLVRSAGLSAQLIARETDFAIIKLPSKETRKFPLSCKATIGIVSNPDNSLETSGKAGRNRWFGIKPRTRAVAMNPVDHPMGGGEGKASGGHPRSRKGKYAKGMKTRKKNKLSNKYIIERRKEIIKIE